MKRFACTLLCGALLLTFAGCGKEETKVLTEKETAQTTAESVQATEKTETMEPEKPQMDLETATATYETVWVTKDDFRNRTEKVAPPDTVGDGELFLMRFTDAPETGVLLHYYEPHNGQCDFYGVWCSGQYAAIENEVINCYGSRGGNSYLEAGGLTIIGGMYRKQVFSDTDNAPMIREGQRDGKTVYSYPYEENGDMMFHMYSKSEEWKDLGKVDAFIDTAISRDDFYSVDGTIAIQDGKVKFIENPDTYMTVGDTDVLEREFEYCKSAKELNHNDKPYTDFSSVDEILAYNAAELQ